MSKFTNFRNALTLEIGSWLIRKLINTLEDKYGREPKGNPAASDSASSTGPTDGDNRSKTRQD